MIDLFIKKARLASLPHIFSKEQSKPTLNSRTHYFTVVLLGQFENKLICGYVRLLPTRGKILSDLVDHFSHACPDKRELFSPFVMFILSGARGADCA